MIPFGHSMLSLTSDWRSSPFSPAFSIFAGLPQSDQYMNLIEQGQRMREQEREQWQDKNGIDNFPVTYPWMGSTTMALGFSSSVLIRVFILVPSIVATEIDLVPESVQYIFLWIQSIARHSGIRSPCSIKWICWLGSLPLSKGALQHSSWNKCLIHL